MKTSNVLLCVAGLAGICSGASGQANLPTEYTVTETMLGSSPGSSITIYRDGARAVIDHNNPGQPDGGHIRSLYEIATGANYTWDVATGDCNRARFSGNGGDPFAESPADELAQQNAKPTGTEMLNGFSTRVYELLDHGTSIKVWVDTKTGALVKEQMTPPNAATQVLAEIKQATFARPPATVFAMPASCAAAAPPPPTMEEQLAADTAGHVADYSSALQEKPSPNSCSVNIRAVKAGSLEPITSGFQIAIDTTYKVEDRPHYTMGVGDNGIESFSGGGLHELTGQLHNGALRIDNVPPYFYVMTHFGKGGDESALVYRQCLGPTAVLVILVRDPSDLAKGGEFLWAKSGKFAPAGGAR
jgi:hypothetical protein